MAALRGPDSAVRLCLSPLSLRVLELALLSKGSLVWAKTLQPITPGRKGDREHPASLPVSILSTIQVLVKVHMPLSQLITVAWGGE